MSVLLNKQLHVLESPVVPVEMEERFAERRRIALYERDPALRPVITRTLLRLGCVVSAKSSMNAVREAMLSGPIDGVVVALDGDEFAVNRLLAANRFGVPIVVLTNDAVDPTRCALAPRMHFLRKPFDMRELLRCLRLPERAVIVQVPIPADTE